MQNMRHRLQPQEIIPAQTLVCCIQEWQKFFAYLQNVQSLSCFVAGPELFWSVTKFHKIIKPLGLAMVLAMKIE